MTTIMYVSAILAVVIILNLSTLTSEISRYLTAVRTVPVISLTMLLRPSLRHWESLISFRLQIL